MTENKPKRNRSARFQFWVSEEEAALIRERMAGLGVTSLGAYFRKMAIDGYHINVDLTDVRELISLLRRCSNNLNQIAKRANETRSIYEADIEDLRQQYDTLWDAANGILAGLAKIKIDSFRAFLLWLCYTVTVSKDDNSEVTMSNLYEQVVALWRGWRVETAADIDLRLHNFRILFAYNSGKIENAEITYHDTREIFENGRVVNFTGDPRSVFELENQKLCYEFLKHKIAAREPMTVPLVLEVHSILTSGTYDERRYIERGERPGAFKKHDYVTGREEVGSLPEDVPADMEELLGELARYANGDVLKAAAYFHARFEYIHPFADGNGRTGRALMNYFLMLHDHPPLTVYDEDKAAYYAALECYDKDEDIQPMHDFLCSQIEKTWEKSLGREERRADRPSVIVAIRADAEAKRKEPPAPRTSKQKSDPEL